MFELIAEGLDARQRWKRPLAPEEVYVLGRDVAADLPVRWELRMSRRHAQLRVSDDGVEIERLPAATNPIFHNGQPVEFCRLSHGDHIVIGATSFYVVRLSETQPSSEAKPIEEVAFDRRELAKVRFRDANKQMEVLTHLPDVIGGSRSEADLFHRLANLLLAGIPHAEAVAIVRVISQRHVNVLHWDRRRETEGEFRPSTKLCTEAILERKSSLLHVWRHEEPGTSDYTAVAEFDWAFCTPVAESKLEPWGLYVAGCSGRPFGRQTTSIADAADLQADVKFTELLSEVISAVRRVNQLERQQSGLRQFFAPPILSALGDDLDTQLLEPKECEVTVLFCDLRGFSQRAELEAKNLIGLLGRVSQALGVMTYHISKYGGVTGDFQGDAALGFWGWPFASEEAPLNACRAALGIRKAFLESGRTEGHPLQNFQMGIGIAHGLAVAGKIGTEEQVKVTVFGPVVNLASRLEGMTRQLRVPILLDEATAQVMRERLAPSEGRLRRLARVLPFGMETPVLVSELLPPASDLPELSDSHLLQFEQGVDHFLEGRWEDAYRCLHGMPATDRAQDFLTLLIAQHDRRAPDDWDGITRLARK